MSVLIIHVGGYDHLQGCLRTLFGTVERSKIEALVVDNRSGTPGLEALIAEFPGARIVALKSRVGYAAATNHGIAASIGRHILWCNDDLLFHPGAVDRLASFLDSNAEYGAAGPRILNPDGSFQPCFSLVHISLFNLIIERLNVTNAVPSAWSLARSWMGHENEERDVAVGGGACMMIRRSALESIGGNVDERFFLYTEEFDLSYRMQLAGWRIRYVPAATVVHLGSQSTVGPAAVVPAHLHFVVQSWRSRFAYLLKHSGPAAERVYAAVFVLTAIPRWLVTSVRGIAAGLRGDARAAAILGARARLHAFASRMALTSRRHEASEYPAYPQL